MTRDRSAGRKPTGNTVPSEIGTSPKISPGTRSPTTRAIPSTSFTGSMRPSRTAKSAPSQPPCAAYSPGARKMSAAARLSRSRAAGPSPAKIGTAPISSVVTMARRYSTGGGAARGPGLGAVLQPDHEPQAAPRLVDRAHLVVDEGSGQRELAHDVLGQVRLDLRGPLRPGDPQARVRHHALP